MQIAVRYAAAGALIVATGASAQSRAPDAAQPTAPAPVLRYASAFEGYKPLGDDSIGNWRAVNDRVREAAAKGAHTGPGAAAAPAAGAPAQRTPGTVAPQGPLQRPGTPSAGGPK